MNLAQWRHLHKISKQTIVDEAKVSIDLESDTPFKRKNGFSYSSFRPLSEIEKKII